MNLKKHISIKTLLVILIMPQAFFQSSNGVYIKSSFGVQSDYVVGNSKIGGGLGLGLDIGKKLNRWQAGFNLDKFPNNNSQELPNH